MKPSRFLKSEMLTENDVIAGVRDYLKSVGFDKIQCLKTNQRGDDIIAERSRDSLEVFVEAKGETSARLGSYKHGQPFDYPQVLVHVATAFYRAAKMLQQVPHDRNRLIAIALPKTQRHLDRIADIQTILNRLQIGVFWVSSDLSVELVAEWSFKIATAE